MDSASALLRLLGDDVRLRLLRALSLEALNVSELTAILGIAQSGVSRHLGLLRDAGLVVEDRTGSYAWFRLAPGAAAPDDPRAALWAFLRAEFAHPAPAFGADDARLQEVRRVRKESFTRHGVDAKQGQIVPGRSWAAWSRALGLLLPAVDVADLGCGDGYLALEAASWARRVIAVDRSAAVLGRARALAARRRVRNVVWKQGELERLPLADASVDIALLSQALHHAADPAAALAEAHRVLRPGGRVLILDLRAHDEGWVRTRLGDRWLGFDEEELRRKALGAGFSAVTMKTGARISGDPFVVLIAAGTKATDGQAPAAGRRTKRQARSRRTSSQAHT